MPKLYKNLYTPKISSQPVKAKGSVSISTGKLKSILLPAVYSEGRLTTLVVKQVSGTPVDYTVEILDSKVPHHNSVDGNSERAYNASAASPIELYRVIDQQTATAGNAIQLRREVGYPFINSDSISNTENESYLYVTIIPTNAGGATSWDFVVITENNNNH